MEEFVKWIDCIEDERQQSKVQYTVQEIVLIVFSATLSGIYEWEIMELWARHHINMFRDYLDYPNGIPSHDTSLSFGVTYNKLHLVYIALFSVSLFSLCILMGKFHTAAASQQKVCKFRVTKGIKVFPILSGISLFVAWLPDIITSLAKGWSLELIEVYTTEVYLYRQINAQKSELLQNTQQFTMKRVRSFIPYHVRKVHRQKNTHSAISYSLRS